MLWDRDLECLLAGDLDLERNLLLGEIDRDLLLRTFRFLRERDPERERDLVRDLLLVGERDKRRLDKNEGRRESLRKTDLKIEGLIIANVNESRPYTRQHQSRTDGHGQ